jgi:glutamine amidotransferase
VSFRVCRIAAYLGREQIPLSSLVLEPKHSLLVQSYAPSDASYSELLGVTDSETIFSFLLDRLRDAKTNPGDSEALTEATAETVLLVSTLCMELGIYASLNLGVTDGEVMAFSRYSTEGPGNSLYFVEGGEAFPDAVVVASERLDGDAGWRQVPDRHLLTVESKGATTHPL